MESIRWQNWTQVIDAVSIQRETAGRVEVSERNQLVIHRLLMSDTAPYRLLTLTSIFLRRKPDITSEFALGNEVILFLQLLAPRRARGYYTPTRYRSSRSVDFTSVRGLCRSRSVCTRISLHALSDGHCWPQVPSELQVTD